MILEGFRKVLRGKTFLKAIIVVSLCFFGGTMIPNGETYAGCVRVDGLNLTQNYGMDKYNNFFYLKYRVCTYKNIRYFFSYAVSDRNEEAPAAFNGTVIVDMAVQDIKKSKTIFYNAFNQGKQSYEEYDDIWDSDYFWYDFFWYEEEYDKYSNFINDHGCGACAITSLLSTKEKYKHIVPAWVVETEDGIFGKHYNDKEFPINIAGARKVLENTLGKNAGFVYVDDSSKKNAVKTAINNATKKGWPVLAIADKKITATATSGSTKLAQGAHTFLIIGRVSENVVAVIDSTKRENATNYRVKFVNMNNLISGLDKKGVNKDYKNGTFFHNDEKGNYKASNGGVIVYQGVWKNAR